jgi:hypothetical protein
MRGSHSVDRAYTCYFDRSFLPLHQLIVIGKSTYIIVGHMFSALRAGTVFPALSNDTSLDVGLQAWEASSRLMPAVARYTTIDECRGFFRKLADDASALQRRCASS